MLSLQRALLGCLFFVGLLLFGSEVRAQGEVTIPTERRGLAPTTENWNGLYLKLRLSDRWFWYQENHYRRRSSADNRTDFVGRMSQIYNRFGMTYLFNDYFEVTFGPTLVWNYTPERGNPEFNNTVLEPRFWHQWLFTQSVGPVKVLHQFRFEHRFRRDPAIGSEFEYTDRYRYKITGYIPLNKPKMENKTLFLAPSNEVFFQTGKNIMNIHEENRVYTAIGYTYNSVMFFGGHMWTYGPTAVPGIYRNRHIIRLNVMFNLDFRNSRRPIIRDQDLKF
ncbi:hypothetical protein A3SI_08636 [Nitritalea halalkaliphila LW7]|uniref:DUF2490 domain-containing protein n=1 Tax=Nitritalea halalkaliphila LW7 TaxID=1189621 RepID=I5C4L8_9BACT|nr:DUF2490 domain-containing protein [Nitritalea halalkaliphila]EIM76770.1 hypothetical protein A3SI_08636 [Nitritalea halalkaliphila LW7]